MADDRTFVIVGASLAGAKAAETLRAEGFEGRIVLVGEEPVRPYERPPLSKGYLRGEASFDDAAVHVAGFYADHDIELLTSTIATAIDPDAQRGDRRPGGQRIPYDQLLLVDRRHASDVDHPGIEPGRDPLPADRRELRRPCARPSITPRRSSWSAAAGSAVRWPPRRASWARTWP